jgi:hypothetical protein
MISFNWDRRNPGRRAGTHQGPRQTWRAELSLHRSDPDACGTDVPVVRVQLFEQVRPTRGLIPRLRFYVDLFPATRVCEACSGNGFLDGFADGSPACPECLATGVDLLGAAEALAEVVVEGLTVEGASC